MTTSQDGGQAAGSEVAWEADPAGVFFSDRFNVHPDVMAEYGAFDISVVSDLPVFIDPFLLFNSEKPSMSRSTTRYSST